MFPKVQIDVDDVIHVDKVTTVFAVLVAVTGPKELYAAMLAKLIEVHGMQPTPCALCVIRAVRTH